jgi:hypothetical protein
LGGIGEVEILRAYTSDAPVEGVSRDWASVSLAEKPFTTEDTEEIYSLKKEDVESSYGTAEQTAESRLARHF